MNRHPIENGAKDAKAALRAEVRNRIASMAALDRDSASAAIRVSLVAQPLWTDARSILFFAPIAGEPDIWPLFGQALAEGKTVALPRYNPAARAYEACEVKHPLADVKTGHFEIREPGESCTPLGSNALDLILVPGLAFDLQGRRLGRGKGYYDHILGSLRGIACGVAFDQQIVAEVPVAPHDHNVNCIVTPTRWITPRQPPALE